MKHVKKCKEGRAITVAKFTEEEKQILSEVKEALPHASERIKGEFLGTARTINELNRLRKEAEVKEHEEDQSGLENVCN